MKKILFVFAAMVLFVSSNVFADDVTLTTYYPAPFGMYQEMRVMGNLGVGTTNPQGSLHVEVPLTAPQSGPSLIAGALNTATGALAVATGYQTKASGDYSTAMGVETIASGDSSTAIGREVTASGSQSLAAGYLSFATGGSSTAIGNGVRATGTHATAIGLGTIAQAYDSFVLGAWNVAAGTKTAWVESDPIFVVGNGDDDGHRSNSMTVLKNGNVGIGTTNPTEALDINGQVRIRGGSPAEGNVLTSDANGVGTWQATGGGNVDRVILFSLRWTGAKFVHQKTLILSTNVPGDLPYRVVISAQTNPETGIYNISASFRGFFMDSSEIVSALLIQKSSRTLKLALRNAIGSNKIELAVSDDATLNNLFPNDVINFIWTSPSLR